MTRGVPGTHDYKLINDFFRGKLKIKNSNLLVAKFDKSIDDRCKETNGIK